jgi:hypothetical protein
MSTTATKPVPSLGVPSAPPLPDDLDALLRRLRLPHLRRHAPEVIATAKAQRWDPAEVLKGTATMTTTDAASVATRPDRSRREHPDHAQSSRALKRGSA